MNVSEETERGGAGLLTSMAILECSGPVVVPAAELSGESLSKHLMMSSSLSLLGDGSLLSTTKRFVLMSTGSSEGRRILTRSAYI